MDLSATTLDQAMAWSGSRGTASSATGRYQFMKAALRGLKTEMGLLGSEAFTPALRDRMAVQLLNHRGYSEWQAGRITDARFANRLALEWASLPNITAQNGGPAASSRPVWTQTATWTMRNLSVSEGGRWFVSRFWLAH